MIWCVWVSFLLLAAPLSYHQDDMNVWVTAIQNLLRGNFLPDTYVYLPIYAELLSAIVWPFHLIGLDSSLFIVFVVKWFVIFSYVLCAILMTKIVPEESEIAPLAIVLAPVTIFYIFFGTNHLVMFLSLLISIILIKRKKWFLAGVFAGFSCYKFLLIPTIIVLVLLIVIKEGYPFPPTTAIPELLWLGRGTVLGLFILGMMTAIIFEKDKRDYLLIQLLVERFLSSFNLQDKRYIPKFKMDVY